MLQNYLRKLFETYRHGREESFYPILKEFLENRGVQVVVLPKKTSAGFPDFKVLQREGFIIGYIEGKNPSQDLDNLPERDKEQIERYKRSFKNFILTNFLEFRHYLNGEEVKRVKLLEFKDFEKGKLKPKNVGEFEELIADFINYQEKPLKSAQELAKALAWRVRILKEEIQKELKTNQNLKRFYEQIRKYIVHNLKEEEFADTIAQALAYALLILRLQKDFIRKEEVVFQIPQSLNIIRDIFLEILKIEGKEIEWIISEIENTLNLFEPSKEKLTPEELTIHFYEPFLKEYNPQLREIRGVYYTPKAVVKFIVKSVEEILKTHFGFNGFFQRELKLLDPAGGTLTFILEVLQRLKGQIEDTYGEGFLKEYFERYVLNNFYAFELLPAPYVIGHLKVGRFLSEIGLENRKFKFFLTNALEFSHRGIPYLFSQEWAKEIREADRIKTQEKILVIIGNPPYSGISANNQKEINEFLKEDKDGCQSYYKVDGNPLGEKNPKWLQDDYVKFIRFGQWKIQKGGKGILAYITNHSYIDNPTFRGMRQSLLKTFDRIYILDLHGNKRKREPDENVFDIQQGVAIGIFVKDGSKKGDYADVYYYSTLEDGKLLTRSEKFEFLENNTVSSIDWHKVNPKSPFYFFKPFEALEEYQNFWSVGDIFKTFGVGMTTARDHFVVDFDKNILFKRILRFKNSKMDEEYLHSTFSIRKKKGWSILEAWKQLQNLSEAQINSLIKPVLYRPFDQRYIFWHKSVVWRTVDRVMSHMLKGENLGLITNRIVKLETWQHAFITKFIIESSAISNKTSEISYLFPLYLYTPHGKQPNFTAEFRKYIKNLYGKEPTPEEILYYIYAILYSPTYREKYREQLKYDFPRIPFTEDYQKFKKLSEFGEKLVNLHLLEDKSLNTPSVRFKGKGTNEVEKVSYKNHKVYINKDQYFEPVSEEVWNYKIGGYQVLKKWLSYRKGRKLTLEEIETFMKTVKALEETIKLQGVIEKETEFV